MAPYGASEAVQSTVRSSEATLKGILQVFLNVFSKVNPNRSLGEACRNLGKYAIAAASSAAPLVGIGVDMWSRLPKHRSAEETTTRSLARGDNAIKSTPEAIHTLYKSQACGYDST